MAQRRRRRIRPGDAGRPDLPGRQAEPAGGPPDAADPQPERAAGQPERTPRPPDRTAGAPERPVPVARPAEPPVRRSRERSSEDRETERGLRGLVGGGSSQVGVSAAMRARDAARPRPEDLAAAEEHLPIVLRGWVPRDPPPAR